MKKLFLLINFLIVSVALFAQDDSEQEPSTVHKFASWTISDAFQAEAGFSGSYWKPTFNIALDKEGYYCVVNLYNSTGYYNINQ